MRVVLSQNKKEWQTIDKSEKNKSSPILQALAGGVEIINDEFSKLEI